MSTLISVEDIEDGMQLAEPIVNSFGQTLLGGGVVLGQKHKRILKTWNVLTIYVNDNDASEGDTYSEEALKLAEERIGRAVSWEPRNNSERDLIKFGVLWQADCISGPSEEDF
ncbi:MAG: hypothetical protein ACM3U1_04965 [Chloroflexota bacterium]